jgi:site-specific recombinase XerD
MENVENILKDFEEYLTVDRQLERETIKKHMIEIKRFFKRADFNPFNAEKVDIRNYLANFKNASPNTYANVLKTLRIFYRDYLGKGEVIEGFKLPNRPFRRVCVPSKEELQKFYQWLKEPLARALFLIYATTGLRRKEVINLKIGDIDFNKRMIAPKGNSSRTKHTWITFYNEEAEATLKEYLGSSKTLNKEARLFPVTEKYFAFSEFS